MWNFSPRRRAAQQNGASGDKSASQSAAAEERRCGGRHCTALVLWTVTVAAVFFVLGLSTPLAPAVSVLRPFALAANSDSRNATEPSSASLRQHQTAGLLDAATSSITAPPPPPSAALDELRVSAESCASAQSLLHPPLHELLAGPHAAALDACRRLQHELSARLGATLAIRVSTDVHAALSGDPVARRDLEDATGRAPFVELDPALPPGTWSIEESARA